MKQDSAIASVTADNWRFEIISDGCNMVPKAQMLEFRKSSLFHQSEGSDNLDGQCVTDHAFGARLRTKRR